VIGNGFRSNHAGGQENTPSMIAVASKLLSPLRPIVTSFLSPSSVCSIY